MSKATTEKTLNDTTELLVTISAEIIRIEQNLASLSAVASTLIVSHEATLRLLVDKGIITPEEFDKASERAAKELTEPEPENTFVN